MRYLPPVPPPLLRATMTPLVDLGLMLLLVVWCRRTAHWFPRVAVSGAAPAQGLGSQS